MAPPTITGDWPVLQFENGRLAYYPGVGWANDDIACTIRNTAARDTALTILQEAVQWIGAWARQLQAMHRSGRTESLELEEIGKLVLTRVQPLRLLRTGGIASPLAY